MNRTTLAINSQKENERLEIEAWKRLTALADANDIKGFYREYATYLRARGIESGYRETIYRMALAVVDQRDACADGCKIKRAIYEFTKGLHEPCEKLFEQ